MGPETIRARRTDTKTQTRDQMTKRTDVIHEKIKAQIDVDRERNAGTETEPETRRHRQTET